MLSEAAIMRQVIEARAFVFFGISLALLLLPAQLAPAQSSDLSDLGDDVITAHFLLQEYVSLFPNRSSWSGNTLEDRPTGRHARAIVSYLNILSSSENFNRYGIQTQTALLAILLNLSPLLKKHSNFPTLRGVMEMVQQRMERWRSVLADSYKALKAARDPNEPLRLGREHAQLLTLHWLCTLVDLQFKARYSYDSRTEEVFAFVSRAFAFRLEDFFAFHSMVRNHLAALYLQGLQEMIDEFPKQEPLRELLEQSSVGSNHHALVEEMQRGRALVIQLKKEQGLKTHCRDQIVNKMAAYGFESDGY